MKRHKFNIFPEANPEDFNRLKEDIQTSGYDKNQPVMLFQGGIIDGWNRQKACDALGVTPAYKEFHGTDADAIAFMMRTNKRRNLNKGQWACIAAEADELLAVIREDSDKNKGGRPKVEPEKPQQKIVAVNQNRNVTDTKAAEAFNTNRTYVNQAVKMKEAAPEVFEKVKAGKMTMQDANKAVRSIPTEPWKDDEKQRQNQVEEGLSVVANQQRDKNLIRWAEKKGLVERVDRGSKFGNPFVLGADGDRDAVCDAYRDHYLPNKPSILKALPSLKGKVLVCHCYPERCHAEALTQ